eukprot:TRINITY_DN4637_c0_g2_i1.p1 TRINITY_DN4637_c0_g2~~TRINITY_DN4637_c0_g2_i1.p1  ORF type:complete len:340 (+),score=102.09 TRINITY_DN4637_c0_g2_i1:87-1022(+)
MLSFRSVASANKKTLNVWSRTMFVSATGPGKLFPASEAELAAAKERILSKKGFIIDMDGVLYHQSEILPGVKNFLKWLEGSGKNFLFLTNSSDNGPKEYEAKLHRLTNIRFAKERFYTSALATADFLQSQTPFGSAYVIGGPGIINALYAVGYTMNDVNPDYVVVGETSQYTFQMIERAAHHVRNGARLIGTNRDIMDKVRGGFVPGTRALLAPIELMTGKKAYFVGKPNPLIMSTAMRLLNTAPSDTVILGDNMDTDIVAGIELGIDTVLMLSGVTRREDLGMWAYKPTIVLEGLIELSTPDDSSTPAHS